MKRPLRIVGTLCAGAGVLAALWALTVWRWQDPFTALYTTHQQQRLETVYEQRRAAYTPPVAKREPVRAQRAAIAQAALRYRQRLGARDAVGRLIVPRLGLDAIIVNGTDGSSLTKGPGRYEQSYVPGEGELVYIAGHRTTYGAPFAHIERMRPGDRVTIEVPYGTFTYRVRNSIIVPADDVKRLRSSGYEVLALQACHPRFFATQRYIVYATPMRVVPRGGTPYTIRR